VWEQEQGSYDRELKGRVYRINQSLTPYLASVCRFSWRTREVGGKQPLLGNFPCQTSTGNAPLIQQGRRLELNLQTVPFST
jgi:hypothetical protein